MFPLLTPGPSTTGGATYTATAPITVTGTVISHDDATGTTAVGNNWGATEAPPYTVLSSLTRDAKGHVNQLNFSEIAADGGGAIVLYTFFGTLYIGFNLPAPSQATFSSAGGALPQSNFRNQVSRYTGASDYTVPLPDPPANTPCLYYFINDSPSGVLTIAPASPSTIHGLRSIYLQPGQKATIYISGESVTPRNWQILNISPDLATISLESADHPSGTYTVTLADLLFQHLILINRIEDATINLSPPPPPAPRLVTVKNAAATALDIPGTFTGLDAAGSPITYTALIDNTIGITIPPGNSLTLAYDPSLALWSII